MEKIKKYFDFDGVSTRSEYWGVYLTTIGLLFPVLFLVGLLSLLPGVLGMLLSTGLLSLALVVLLIVYTATNVKRCRDAGLNPWFTLALLIPTVNFVCWIVFGCLPSEKNDD
jgi:uncharacterized membrane protein YhaH (DUF805 family)